MEQKSCLDFMLPWKQALVFQQASKKGKTAPNPLNMFGISPSSITCITLTLTVNQPKQVIHCQRRALKQTPENEEGLPTLSEPWSFCGIKLSTSKSQLLNATGTKWQTLKQWLQTKHLITQQTTRSIAALLAACIDVFFVFSLMLKKNPTFFLK